MNHRKSFLPIALLAVFLIGCSTLYTGVVSLTSVVDSAMKEWAAMSVAGQTTPSLDANVIKAHDQYRLAAGVAKRALITYKAGGDQAAYISALQAAKVAADGLLNIIYPLLTVDKADEFKGQLAKANSP
jgi:hypothetical protein